MSWLITGIIFLLLSAFFSGMEMAFLSASKLKIELSKNQGKRSGTLLAYFNKKPSHFISTYLIGNNIALVIYGLAVGALLAPLWQNTLPNLGTGWAILLETLIATLIILIIGEFLPKLIFRLQADRLLHGLSIPFAIFYGLLYLPVIFINSITKGLMRTLFKIQITDNDPIFTEVDLEHYLKTNQQGGDDDDIDAELLGNALELKDVKVRECMVPRPEISAIDMDASIGELRDTIIESGYSKIMVYQGNLDNVFGYVHHFDLHKNPKTIGDIIKPIPIVPESMLAQSLLSEFKKKGKSMALVVDEYGGTSGIVTFEDILEEIFGEIQDEHDEDDFIEQQLAKNEFLFSGRLEIDHINETYDLNLPEGDFETLSGYIISLTENIPERKAVIETDSHELTILNVSKTKIETVKVRVKDSLL